MRMSDWSSDVCSSDLVFCRFSGCNLWSGREADRASAICQFCDTDFVGIEGVGGGRFSSADALAEAIEVAWAGAAEQRFVVFTGGEPLLQVNAELIAAMHDRNFECAVESNGTQPAPADLDWICVSPKAGAPMALSNGNEIDRKSTRLNSSHKCAYSMPY